jgi:hypothetical protein
LENGKRAAGMVASGIGTSVERKQQECRGPTINLGRLHGPLIRPKGQRWYLPAPVVQRIVLFLPILDINFFKPLMTALFQTALLRSCGRKNNAIVFSSSKHKVGQVRRFC